MFSGIVIPQQKSIDRSFPYSHQHIFYLFENPSLFVHSLIALHCPFWQKKRTIYRTPLAKIQTIEMPKTRHEPDHFIIILTILESYSSSPFVSYYLFFWNLKERLKEGKFH